MKTTTYKLIRCFISLAVPFVLIPLASAGSKEAQCAYVMLLMVSYWILQPIPLPVTSLFPVVFYPFFGILSTEDACAPYASAFVVFMWAGFMLSVAMEESCLHQRLALKILLIVGTSNIRLLFGFIFCTGFLSMWFNNTACAAMMLPIAEGVIAEKRLQKNVQNNVETPLDVINTNASRHLLPDSTGCLTELKESDGSSKELSLLRKGFLLGIAYASSIGGTGTLIGAGSNIILVGYVTELFPGSTEINFGSWLIYAVPGMIAVLLTCGIVLYLTNIRKCAKYDGSSSNVKMYLQRKYLEQGPISFQQGAVIFLILAFIILLFCRDPKIIPGWGSAFSEIKLKDAQE